MENGSGGTYWGWSYFNPLASRHLVSLGRHDSHEFVTGLDETEAPDVPAVDAVRPVHAQIRPRKTPQMRPSR